MNSTPFSLIVYHQKREADFVPHIDARPADGTLAHFSFIALEPNIFFTFKVVVGTALGIRIP